VLRAVGRDEGGELHSGDLLGRCGRSSPPGC
jgi:hypothetical protein